MQIRQLYIKGFGKLKHLQISFNSGLNIIYGPNESGKTTLYNFVRSCLCNLDESELKKYEPWDGEEFGGEISIYRDKEEVVLSSFSAEKPFERSFADSLMFLSDEEDVELRKAEDSLVARMRNNLQRVEEAQLLKLLLNKVPDYGEILLSEKRQLEIKLKEIENELQKFHRARQESFLRAAEISKLTQKISTLHEEQVKLQTQMDRLYQRIEEFLKQLSQDLERKLKEIEDRLAHEKKYTIIDDQQYEHISKAKARLEESSALYKERSAKMEEMSRLLQKTIEEREELLKSFGEKDIETFRLKVKNLHLTYKLLETKLEQIREFESSYQDNWKYFEKFGENFLDELMNERMRVQDQEEAQLRGKLKVLEEDVAKDKRRIGQSRLTAIVLLLAAVVSTILGFSMTRWWFMFSGALGLGALIFALRVRSLDKRVSHFEEEMLKCQLELRMIEKKRATTVQKFLESFGVKDATQLRQIYEEYRDWSKEKERFERMKSELQREVEDLLRELRQHGAHEFSDVPTVILRLEEKVSLFDEKTLKIAQLRETIEHLRSELNALDRERQLREIEFERLLHSFGLESYDEAQEAHERYHRVENLTAEKEKLERVKNCLEKLDLECLSKQYAALSNLLGEKTKLESLLKKVDGDLFDLQSQLAELEKHIDDESILQRTVELLRERSLIELLISTLNMKLERLPSFSQFLSSELENLTGSYVKSFANLFVGTFRRFSKLANNVIVDRDLSVKIAVGTDLQRTESVLSRATLDQMVLCYKLALHDILELSEPLPLIVDNFMIRFDEERLRTVAELLQELSQRRQVVLLTSDRQLVDFLKVQPVAYLS
ncbi:MAG: AAA family ATPase [Pseudothermotoga sp.]|uniref:ATP-binding protein n=1 Tax=Pseudothermotoga sp. TaxID=2033661 RepID=UPI002584608A|nr:AAA family ATPase [Pseudothermotoga sp.]MDI6863239.1 AAA family ATPase [Pseudothermotoga sp.]